MVEVFVVFGLVPARRGERVGVGAREHRAVGEIEEFGRVANAERVEHQFTRTDVDEGVYELLHAGVAAFVFVCHFCKELQMLLLVVSQII